MRHHVANVRLGISFGVQKPLALFRENHRQRCLGVPKTCFDLFVKSNRAYLGARFEPGAGLGHVGQGCGIKPERSQQAANHAFCQHCKARSQTCKSAAAHVEIEQYMRSGYQNRRVCLRLWRHWRNNAATCMALRAKVHVGTTSFCSRQAGALQLRL